MLLLMPNCTYQRCPVLYVLSKYSNVGKILLLEKYDDVATLNSNSRNNAQILHFGNIETNYSVEKAPQTKEASQMVINYTDGLPESDRKRIITKIPKMVLAVGDEEVGQLDETYLKGKSGIFLAPRRIGKEEMATVEPNTMEGRDPDEEEEVRETDGIRQARVQPRKVHDRALQRVD